MKIIAFIYYKEVSIRKIGTSEIIICNERIDNEEELQEIIKHHWNLNIDEYKLTVIN